MKLSYEPFGFSMFLVFILLCMIVDSEKWKYGFGFPSLFMVRGTSGLLGGVQSETVIMNCYNGWVFEKKNSQFDAVLSLLIFVVKTVLDFPERNKGNTLMLWCFVVVWLRELRRHSFLVWFLIVKYKRDSELWTLCCEFFFFGLISISLDV